MLDGIIAHTHAVTHITPSHLQQQVPNTNGHTLQCVLVFAGDTLPGNVAN